MGKLNNAKYVVETLLNDFEVTRGDDNILYLFYLRYLNIDTNMPVKDFLMRKDIPKFDTISRMRRKVQEENPKLRPSKEIEKARYEEQLKYADFSQGWDYA